MNATSEPSSPLRIAFVGLLCLAVAMGIGRFAFTPLLPLMQADGVVDIASGGLLASIHFVGYWVGALIAARLPYPPGFILRVSLIAIGICTLGMGLTNSFILWAILRWLAGVCSAFTLVMISNFYVKYLAEAGFARAQGWVFSGVGAGITIAGLGTLALMAAGIDSAISWQIFGVATLAVAGLLCIGIGPEIDHSYSSTRKQRSRGGQLNWRIIIPYGALGIGYVIPATYLPVMAREIIQSPFLFGWAWPVFGAAAFLSTLVAARLQPRYSNRQIWAASQMIMSAGLLLPVIFPHIIAILMAGICVGGTFMIITMMGMKEAHGNARPEDVMRLISVMTAAFATGQIVGPLFAGWIYELTTSFSASLVLASILLIVTALLLMGRSALRSEISS